MQHHHPPERALAVGSAGGAAPRSRLQAGLRRALAWVVIVVVVSGTLEASAHRLQQPLPQTDVLHLGIHGFGHDQMLVYLLTLDAERFFDEYCRQRDALCLDLRPTFLEKIGNGLPIKVPGHWQGNGHALVADEQSSFLTDHGLVPS